VALYGLLAGMALIEGLVTAGKDMVGALGAEVDRLESEIKRVMPGIRHIDLVRIPAGMHCCMRGLIYDPGLHFYAQTHGG